MRRILAAPLLALALTLSALPAGARPPQADQAKQADLADVLTYVRLFGYRDMLELGVERQLRELADYYRDNRPDVPRESLEAIFGELRAELAGSVDESEREMAQVLQRHLSREDVAYLVGVGADPRMQKVVRLQPRIARDLEPVSERLADRMVARAIPRIEQRLRSGEAPQGGL